MQQPSMREMIEASLKGGMEGASVRLRSQLVSAKNRRKLQESAYQPGVSDTIIRVTKEKGPPKDDTAPREMAPLNEEAATPVSISEGSDADPMAARQAFLERLRAGLVTLSIRATNIEGESTIAALLDASKLTGEEAQMYEDMCRVISPDQMREVRRGPVLMESIEQLYRTMTPHCYVWTPLLLLLNSGTDYDISEENKEPTPSNKTGRNALIQVTQLIDYLTYAITNITHLRTMICNKLENEEGRKLEEEHLESLKEEFKQTEVVRQEKYGKLHMWALEACFGKDVKELPALIPTFLDVWGDPSMDPSKMLLDDMTGTCAGAVPNPAADQERIKLLQLVAQRRRVVNVIATSIYRLTAQRCHNLCLSLCQFMGVTPEESLLWGFLINRVPTPEPPKWTWPRGGFPADFGYACLLRNLAEIDVLHNDYDRAAVRAAIEKEKGLIVGTDPNTPREQLSGGSLTIAWCYWAFIMSALAQKSNVKDEKTKSE